MNSATDPNLLELLLAGKLNRVRCEHCERVYPSETPVYIHDPDLARYICLFPSAWRSRELDLRIEFYQELLGVGEEAIPGYVREARFLFGLESCRKMFDRHDRMEDRPSEGVRPVDTPPADSFVPAYRDLVANLLDRVPYRPPVRTSHPLVEAGLLVSDQGALVTLVNWSGAPLVDVEVTIRVSDLDVGVPATVCNPIKKMSRTGDDLVVILDLPVIDFITLLSR